MTKIQLQQLLEKAYNSHFLESIEILIEKETEYKKSDFFKQTKISLFVLYEKFFAYQESKYSLSNKIDEFINDIDTDKLSELLVEALDKISTNERLKEMISKFLENFDLDKLIGNSEELQAVLKDFKNKII
jgi:ubiquinone biosynthesis protein Coq4